MVERPYRYLCVAAIAFWMGGFTFYSLVVIPTGNHLLGSIEQGLLTQQVTAWMNLIGVLSLAILLPAAKRSKWLLRSWFVMAAMLICLFALHREMDTMIDARERVVTSDSFIRWHQAYLVAVTVQWAAALYFLWGLTMSPPVGAEIIQRLPGSAGGD